MGVIKQFTNWAGAILYVCLNMLEHTIIHIHIHICIFIHICTHIYIYMYVCVYLYIYIYVCVYFLSVSLSYYMKMHAPKNRNSPGTLLEPFAVGLQSWANLTTYPGGPSGEVWHTFTLHNFASHTDQKPNPLWIWQPIFLASGFSFWYLLHLRHFLMQVFMWPHLEVKWVCVNIRCTHVR